MTRNTSLESANRPRRAANTFVRDLHGARANPRNRNDQHVRMLEQFRIAARFFHGASLVVLVALATTGLALVGVYIAVHTALTHHGLDPAAATSLGDGITDVLDHLNPVLVITGVFTLAAMITNDILTNIMRKRQATPLTPDPVASSTETQVQASVKEVFGSDTVRTTAFRYDSEFRATHPADLLHFDALADGLHADMNASLPEPFTIEDLDSTHITGPDLKNLPANWTAAARKTFESMDLHLENYTFANVQAWRAQGNSGYPWPPYLPAARRTARR
ncbi:hypothetical protein ABH924_003295 [Arthrobacter sp. GAS37]|uniref:hypothetical protein n=1 Tax=Arthrobacter sp. GAS37 TaxID=3156261 RepID=UPI00383831CB